MLLLVGEVGVFGYNVISEAFYWNNFYLDKVVLRDISFKAINGRF